ncbi:MAG: DUF711 family protein [Anaerolineae bacterium]
MKIRSITVFADLDLALDGTHLAALSAFAHAARDAYTNAGFDVQTLRLATNVASAPQASTWANRPVDLAIALEHLAVEHGFAYVALGPVPTALLPRLPEVFAATARVFAAAPLVEIQSGTIDGSAIRGCAEVIHRCAAIEDGFGNLRFAALAHVGPGTPFFPAAYHAGGPPAFAIATQAADLAVDACREAENAAVAHRRLVAALEHEGARLVAVAERLADTHGLRFDGIDFSLAPYPDPAVSVGAALERLSGQLLGAPGTLTAAATLAAALDEAAFPHAGFCGLMMPVLEDPVLAQRAAEGHYGVGEMLQWSAVCGTGLDTVPLPGDATPGALAHVLFDVAALSVRLRKPLTARLMPLPGKAAGDPVHFDFAYFADGGVLPLPVSETEGKRGLLARTEKLALAEKGHRNRKG